MYYYYDNNHVLQGPFSESAFTKWYVKEYMPSGTQLLDKHYKPCLIDDIVRKSLKSETKVIFCDDSIYKDTVTNGTAHDTSLQSSDCINSMRSDEFTQIESLADEVDEVDCGKEAEQDVEFVSLQRMANIYVDCRARNNMRRTVPDKYVPFEYPWSHWVPHSLIRCDALRGALHIRNLFQAFDEYVFSQYLNYLSIEPHPCHLCQVSFENSYQMLSHFLSVVHINRTYNLDQNFSMIDITCVRKMISDVETLLSSGDSYCLNPQKTSNYQNFFHDIDITTAFESLKSTVSLLESVPLLNLPPRGTSRDTCGYIEAVVHFREIEHNYNKISKCLRSRSFGATGETMCTFCNMEFDATDLNSFYDHLFSEVHIHNALRCGVTRSEIEYWNMFLDGLLSPRKNITRQQKVSLQENDFPLCYELVKMVPDDIIYSGHEVKQVLHYVRDAIRTLYPDLLHDVEYSTSCRWCQTYLYSRNSVLRHILHDKCHTRRLEKIPNDDIRRLFHLLRITISMPLFRESSVTSLKSDNISSNQLEFNVQRLKNVCYRIYKQREMRQIARSCFPIGLINRCEICNVDIENIGGVLPHFCSTKHTEHLMMNYSRISIFDVEYWMNRLNFPNHSQSPTNFT